MEEKLKQQKKWFEGLEEIDCSIQELKALIDDHGVFFTNVVTLMPGLTSVELMDQGTDNVAIQTNEGLMKRTNISKQIEADKVILEFDEEYQAGSMVTTSSHFLEEFTPGSTGLSHRLVISDVKAPGFLGFFYRKFGSRSIGKAVMQSYRTYLEGQNEPTKN